MILKPKFLSGNKFSYVTWTTKKKKISSMFIKCEQIFSYSKSFTYNTINNLILMCPKQQNELFDNLLWIITSLSIKVLPDNASKTTNHQIEFVERKAKVVCPNKTSSNLKQTDKKVVKLNTLTYSNVKRKII